MGTNGTKHHDELVVNGLSIKEKDAWMYYFCFVESGKAFINGGNRLDFGIIYRLDVLVGRQFGFRWGGEWILITYLQYTHVCSILLFSFHNFNQDQSHLTSCHHNLLTV